MEQATYNPNEPKSKRIKTKEIKMETKKQRDSKNFEKTIRLAQVVGLVLATLLLVRQDFVYAMVLGGFVALTAAELVYRLVYRP